MKKIAAKYRVVEHSDDWIDLLETVFDFESGREIAETAAEHYHDYCDGWESSWPLIFEVVAEHLDGPERYSVDFEAVPSFVASKVKGAS